MAFRSAVLMASLSLTVWPLLAQTRAVINGTVMDPSGATVADAKVQLTSPATGLRREVVTRSNGIYEFPSLPAGTYSISVSKPGFERYSLTNVDLLVGQIRTLDVKLGLGQTSQAVEVTASSELLNRSNAEIDGVIEAPQIGHIPINGRNWATLMTLAPGAINSGGGSQRDIRFDGHSLDDSNFSFDGIDVSGVQEQTQKAETRLNISLDSISEFRVATSVYTAENGAAGGAQINVESKSGTNDFHGSLFEYLRNSALDSPGAFDGGVVPPFRLNQFGAGIGGPIVKNKAFFFVNYEGLRPNADWLCTQRGVPVTGALHFASSQTDYQRVS
jgi:hypothetical protein